MSVRAAGLVVLLLAGRADAGEDGARVRNRFSTGALLGVSQETGAVDVEWIVGDALTARLIDRDALALYLLAAARFDLRFTAEGVRLDDPRIRALGLRLEGRAFTLDLGRFAPLGGGWRLVDGAQLTGDVGRGLRLGLWLGFGPDPYTTLPALRFGGGPVLGWSGARGELTLLGEVHGTPEGIDRASGVARGRVELGRVAELEALVDLQAGGASAPVRLSDATARLRLDPHEDVRVDLVYDAWSSLSYLQSSQRDPALTRFATRSQALLGDPWIPQDALDPTVYHLAGGTVSWRPALGRERLTRLQLDAVGRYRHHAEPLRRHARAGLSERLTGLAGGRVDVGLGQAFLWWQDEPAVEASAWLWAAVDREQRVGLDASGTVVAQPHDDGDGWGPTVYADLFVDAFLGRGVTLAAGYAFSNSQDLDRWDPWHGVLARLGWSFDSARRVARPEVRP